MTSKLNTIIAKTIKKIRLKKGMSQENLGLIAEIDRTYISGIERLTRNPSLKSLEKIINALEVTDKEFIKFILEEINK